MRLDVKIPHRVFDAVIADHSFQLAGHRYPQFHPHEGQYLVLTREQADDLITVLQGLKGVRGAKKAAEYIAFEIDQPDNWTSE